VLAIPYLAAEDQRGAEAVAGIGLADAALRVLGQRHPVADELLDLDRQLEILAQDAHQAGGRPSLVGQQSGKMQLGEVADLVAVAQSRRTDAKQAAHENRKAVAIRPVQADRRFGAGAGAIEQ
jgi:hypothetical protein